MLDVEETNSYIFCHDLRILYSLNLMVFFSLWSIWSRTSNDNFSKVFESTLEPGMGI